MINSEQVTQVIKEIADAFEEYWKTAPVFPVPEEHERHKIASRTAFYDGYKRGLEYAFAMRSTTNPL